MSLKSFENYTQLAQIADANHTEVAGRYDFQASAERRILLDVIGKLKFASNDSLLEIGCGPGNLLIPLSYHVASSTGIDNSASLIRLANRCGKEMSIASYAGDFLTMYLPDTKYSKILIYSVIQHCDDLATAKQFLKRALSLLPPGGRLLLGDLPNQDRKHRFGQSNSGKLASETWIRQLSGGPAHRMATLQHDDLLLPVNDDAIFALMKFGRNEGFESYLLPQPADLPFGNTREDILFVAPK